MREDAYALAMSLRVFVEGVLDGTFDVDTADEWFARGALAVAENLAGLAQSGGPFTVDEFTKDAEDPADWETVVAEIIAASRTAPPSMATIVAEYLFSLEDRLFELQTETGDPPRSEEELTLTRGAIMALEAVLEVRAEAIADSG